MNKKRNYKPIIFAISGYCLGLITYYLITVFGSSEYNYSRYLEKNSNGSPKIDAFYSRLQKRQGVEKTYHDNGAIECLMNYNNGLTDEFFMCFYDNGDLEGVSFYKSSKRNGRVLYFHKNYIIKADEHYIDGLKQGEFKYYDSTGTLTDFEKYDNHIRTYKWAKDKGDIKLDKYGNELE